MNCFMLFRQHCNQVRMKRQDADKQGPRQANISQDASGEWNSLSEEEKDFWRERQAEVAEAHKKMYPDYVYKPRRRRGKGRKKSASRRKLATRSRKSSPSSLRSSDLDQNDYAGSAGDDPVAHPYGPIPVTTRVSRLTTTAWNTY